MRAEGQDITQTCPNLSPIIVARTFQGAITVRVRVHVHRICVVHMIMIFAQCFPPTRASAPCLSDANPWLSTALESKAKNCRAFMCSCQIALT